VTALLGYLVATKTRSALLVSDVLSAWLSFVNGASVSDTVLVLLSELSVDVPK
jgi:hypothetical protein